MNDLALGGAWLGILAGAFAAAVALQALGIATTYVRDLLHIGAGIWVVGWLWWHGSAIPIAIVCAAAIGVALVPALARRSRFVQRLQRCVTSDDEHWGGLVLYSIAYAIFTVIGVMLDPFAAAAALLALSLGDGIGGAVGRALAGALIAAALFSAPLTFAGALALGIVAAITEAFSPRGTDNILIPAAVYIAAHLIT